MDRDFSGPAGFTTDWVQQASKLLADLKTSITDQKWSGADAVIKQLDEVRDRLDADQKTSFDSLKKEYDDKKAIAADNAAA